MVQLKSYTLKKQGPFGFILIGLACACGVLAKYNFVLVILALMAATLFVHGYRQKIFTRNLVLSVIVTIVLVLPHMLWFLANQDLATSETMVRMSLDQKGNYGSDILHGSMELLGAYIAFVIPFVAVYAGCFRGAFHCRLTRPAGILIAYIIASLAAVFAVILVMQVTNIKERWLQPYLFIVPMLAFTLTDIKLIPAKRLNFFISMGLIACALVMLIQPMRVLLVDLAKAPTGPIFPLNKCQWKFAAGDLTGA